MDPGVAAHLGVERRRHQRPLPDRDDPTGGLAALDAAEDLDAVPTSSTHGARMKTACTVPSTPVMCRSSSKESTWRPKALRRTVMSRPPIGLLPDDRRPRRGRRAGSCRRRCRGRAARRPPARAAGRAARTCAPAWPWWWTPRPGARARRPRRARRDGVRRGPRRPGRPGPEVLTDVALERQDADPGSAHRPIVGTGVSRDVGGRTWRDAGPGRAARRGHRGRGAPGRARAAHRPRRAATGRPAPRSRAPSTSRRTCSASESRVAPMGAVSAKVAVSVTGTESPPARSSIRARSPRSPSGNGHRTPLADARTEGKVALRDESSVDEAVTETSASTGAGPSFFT